MEYSWTMYEQLCKDLVTKGTPEQFYDARCMCEMYIGGFE